MFVISRDTKFLADSACDAWDVRQEQIDSDATSVIAWNGRRLLRPEAPKDGACGKRWAAEQIFSRPKEMLGSQTTGLLEPERP